MDLSQRMDIDKWDPEVVARMVAEEVARQDATYGPFDNSVGSVRLAIACMEDETREARESWEQWKKRPDWYGVRAEIIQVAAIAQRLARDLVVEMVD